MTYKEKRLNNSEVTAKSKAIRLAPTYDKFKNFWNFKSIFP